MRFVKQLIAASAVMACSLPASAVIIVLDFEGVGDFNAVGNYYAGVGVVFSGATLALVDADAGGSGNFANEPTKDTIMFFIDANNGIMNVAGGFSTGFSFFYTSATAASVNVYDGLNGTGNLLASIGLGAQHTNNCAGDPNGTFCNWTGVGVLFNGVAMSVDFGGTANQTGFDNITFGTDKPVVPEPSTYALMALGLAGIGAVARRRARKA